MSGTFFTPRVRATWSDAVRRTPRLLVPIAVDALVVRETGGQWADVKMRAPTGDRGNARDLMPPPFQDREARARGVYLHWALPDALTHGSIPETPGSPDSVQFPAVPDRWLVIRLTPTADRRRRNVQGWVLQAGDVTPVVVDLDRWIEGGGGSTGVRKPLTALGHGDPAWAAYFDNVENRLGFHDSLEGITSGPLAYLVCGWHADESLDPLGGPEARVAAVRLERLRALAWSTPDLGLERAVTRAEAIRTMARSLGLPERTPEGDRSLLTLYHGSVVGLGWPQIGWTGQENGLLGGEVGGPPPASAIDVVVGSTMAEAVATLSSSPDRPREPRIVEAVVAGSQGSLDGADGRAQIDAALHARAFVSFAGGVTTETVWQPPTEPQPAPPGRPPRPLPDLGGLAGTLATAAGGGPPPGPGPGATPPRARFEEVRTVRHESLLDRAIVDVKQGTLSEVVDTVRPPTPPPPSPGEPGKFVEVTRSLPRFHAPLDPVILVRGARRSFRHGGDGRFSRDGTLACRLSGGCVTELSTREGEGGERVAARGETLLARGVENGSVPPECEELLRELVLLDPGSAEAAARTTLGAPASSAAAPPGDVAARARRFSVEQTAFWALREPRIDPAPLLVHSGIEGTLPSPVAVTPPVKPWTPLHLDWEVEYHPSAGGTGDWSLGEIDFEAKREETGPPIVLRGRTLLTAGPAALLAGAARETRRQAQRIGTATRIAPHHRARFASDVAGTLSGALAGIDLAAPAEELADVADRLAASDLLAGAIDPFHTGLRGGVPGDGESVPADGALPAPFVALRAGFLRIMRLRLVDAFGQVVDLAGSSAGSPVDPARITWAESLATPGHPDRGLLPPRFTAPARLMLRYVEAGGGLREADDLVSPVCGFLVPHHLEDALEVFDPEGNALGLVRPGEVSLGWEETPGQPGTVGRAPERTIPNPFLAGLVRGLIDYRHIDAAPDAGESALSAFLRLVDSTRWVVDPFAHSGDEHLSLLVGHPIAVLRARLWLEVKDPIGPTGASLGAFPVRLGSLPQWQDGLFAYYVDDDYRRLHLPDGAAARFAREVGAGRGFLQRIDQVAGHFLRFAADLAEEAPEGETPVRHPMVDSSGILSLVPGRVVRLTLLVEPHATVHATTGTLPRKSIGMRRRWVTPGLARLAPTFRFGPLLVDPNDIRMPVAREVGGTWSWQSRAEVGRWTTEPVTHTTGEASLSPMRARATEGWLRLTPDPPAEDPDDRVNG